MVFVHLFICVLNKSYMTLGDMNNCLKSRLNKDFLYTTIHSTQMKDRLLNDSIATSTY